MVGLKLDWAVENCDGQVEIFTLSGQFLRPHLLHGPEREVHSHHLPPLSIWKFGVPRSNNAMETGMEIVVDANDLITKLQLHSWRTLQLVAK